MKSLQTTQLKALDEWLFDYKKINLMIAARKLELETVSNNDINKHYSKGNHVSKHTETVAIRWADDCRIQSLTAFQNAVNKTLSTFDEEMKEVFNKRWRHGLTWEEIAEEMNIKIRSMYRKRQALLERFAYYFGLL